MADAGGASTASLIVGGLLTLLGAGFGKSLLKEMAARRAAREAREEKERAAAGDGGVEFERLRLADEAELRRWLFDTVKAQQEALSAVQRQLAERDREHASREAEFSRQETLLQDRITALTAEVESLRREVAVLRADGRAV